jgi:putative ABC transport system substrate-binding protein
MKSFSTHPGASGDPDLADSSQAKLDSRFRGNERLRRRTFIALLGSAAAWPLAARAETATPVIGLLHGESPALAARRLTAFHRGLGETGYTEGRNVAIEYRWAQGSYARLPDLAAELVARQVGVLVAVGGSNGPLAAKAATATIPIVFITGDDPVKQGLVTSINRPGGNATGINIFISEMEGKRLGLLRQLVQSAQPIGVLLNPAYSVFAAQRREVEEAARSLGQPISIVLASNEEEIALAFETLLQANTRALLVVSEPFFSSRRDKIVALAARHGIPTMYGLREYAVAGGLISYGTDISEAYRHVGLYTGRILKGEKASDLPVVQSTKFELVINLRTAKALGLEIPSTLMALANEVIE